jgi:hypothetical protein
VQSTMPTHPQILRRKPALRGASNETTPAPPEEAIGGSGYVYLGLLFLYPVLNPFYLWKSGLPQIADMLMVLIFLSLGPRGFRFMRDPLQRRAFFMLAGLAVYTAVVSYVWMMVQPSDDFILPPLYYLFNAMVFGSLLGGVACFGARALSCLAWGSAVSLILQVTAMPFLINSGITRQVLFFNNPNQLGYYCLLCTAMMFLAYRSRQVRLWPCLLAAGGAVILVALSLSKAAIIGVGLQLALTAVGRARAVFLIALPLLLLVPTDHAVVSNVGDRLSSIGDQGDDSLAGRGYDRVFDYPQYVLFGAAEGGYERMNMAMKESHEIHSSFGLLLFCYGIPGLTLFFMFLGAVVRSSGMSTAIYLIPAMAYGLTHMGLREGLFWLLLAQVCCLRSTQSPAVEVPAPTPLKRTVKPLPRPRAAAWTARS